MKNLPLKLGIGIVVVFGVLLAGMLCYPELRFRYYSARFDKTLGNEYSRKLVSLGERGRAEVFRILDSRIEPFVSDCAVEIPDGAVHVYFLPGGEKFVDCKRADGKWIKILSDYTKKAKRRKSNSVPGFKAWNYVSIVFHLDGNDNGSLVEEIYRDCYNNYSGIGDFNLFVHVKSRTGNSALPLIVTMSLGRDGIGISNGRVIRYKRMCTTPPLNSYIIDGGGEYYYKKPVLSGILLEENENGEHVPVDPPPERVPPVLLKGKEFIEFLKLNSWSKDECVRFTVGPKATVSDVLRAFRLVERTNKFVYSIWE